ncbi:MAG: O-antigen ligase family protein [Spirochaetia bacterium]|nr:O-antigen ligase family protein [Spirochaetia bacterium]
MLKKKWFDNILDLSIFILIIFAPLAIGCVHIWAYSLLEISIYILLIFWLYYLITNGKSLYLEKYISYIYISTSAFLILLIFQVIPLPLSIIEYLSPKAYLLYTKVFSENTEKMYFTISLYPYASKNELMKFVAYFAIFFLIIQEIQSRKRIQKIIMAIFIVAVIEAFLGIYALFTNNWIFEKFFNSIQGSSGTYVNRNHLSGLLGMTLPLGISYLIYNFISFNSTAINMKQKIIEFINSKDGTKNTVVLILVLILFMGIIATKSRMGIFSALASILFIAGFWITQGKKKQAALVIYIIFIAALLTLWISIEPLTERYSKSIENFNYLRAILWEKTWDLFIDFKYFGAGFGTYEHLFRHYVPEESIARILFVNHAHNDYLEFLASGGIILNLPIAMAFVIFNYSIIKKLSKTKSNFTKSFTSGGLASIVYILLHSITDFNMQIPANAFIFSVILAITYKTADEPKK